MSRFILAFVVLLAAGGCSGVPVLDMLGEPVLDEVGEVVTEPQFDAEKAVEAAAAVAPFIAGPFGAAIPILASLLPLFTGRKD